MIEDGDIPIIAIFTSRNFPDLYSTVTSLMDKYQTEPRIFTYAIGDSSDRFELRRLACASGGAFYELSDSSTTTTSINVRFFLRFIYIPSFPSSSSSSSSSDGF